MQITCAYMSQRVCASLPFASFGLFVRANVTVMVSLFASALAVSEAIFLILEMYQPYSGRRALP